MSPRYRLRIRTAQLQIGSSILGDYPMTIARILMLFTACLLAATAQPQTEDKDYKRLSPAQPTESPGKVEVIEFFSYGCPHCYSMQPLLTKWAKELPANVVLVRVPVSLGHREWGQLSRAYYALGATGDLARLDDALFAAIHKDKRPLFDEESLAVWAASQGVDAAKFRAAFNSFDVTTKATRAEQLARNYQVTSIPHLSVDGKYAALGETYNDILKNARLLVDKAMAERKTGG